MLSETLYKRMMLDREFTSSMTKASSAESEYATRWASGEKPEPAPLNMAYHDYHRSAFELSLLFSPRAARTPSFTGDFLLTVMSIVKMGKVYVSNLKQFISNSNLKKSNVKRLDKVGLNLNQMLEMFDTLEADVQSSIDAYVASGKGPEKSKISSYSKSLLRVRRSYFRVQGKLQTIEKHLDFSAGAYQSYEPLIMLVRSHQGSRSKKASYSPTKDYSEYMGALANDANAYLEAVYNYDTARSKHKKKDYIDMANTAFIASYKLPRDAVVRHANALRNINPTLIYAEEDITKLKPVQKPKALAAKGN